MGDICAITGCRNGVKGSPREATTLSRASICLWILPDHDSKLTYVPSVRMLPLRPVSRGLLPENRKRKHSNQRHKTQDTPPAGNWNVQVKGLGLRTRGGKQHGFCNGGLIGAVGRRRLVRLPALEYMKPSPGMFWQSQLQDQSLPCPIQ